MTPPVLAQLRLARVLHIGAGTGAALPLWLEAGARAIALTEADPELAADLRGLAAAHPAVRVIEAAVSADPAPRPYHRANFPELSSFRAPAALTGLFPGLKLLSQEVVQPADPVALAASLDAEGSETEGAAALAIEAPGEALGILRALAEAGQLARFDLIHLREGARPLYDGAPAAAAIADFLTQAGYRTAFEAAPEDPDRPWLTARLDRAALEAEALRAALQEARAEAATAGAEAEAARAETEATGAQAETARTELEAAQKTAAALRAELEAAHTRAAEAQAEAETLRAAAATHERAERDLAEARRLLDLRAADLAEVQRRHAALFEENQSLGGLLRDLAAALKTPAKKPGTGKTTRKSSGKSSGKKAGKKTGGRDG